MTRARRGFTILEVVLAASVGLGVLIGSISLIYSFERANMRLASRFDEMTTLQRTRLVMGRAFSSMLMSPAARPAAGAAAAGEGAETAASARGAAAASGASGAAAAADPKSGAASGESESAASGSGTDAAGSTSGAAGAGAARAGNRPAGVSGPAGAAQAAAIPPRIWLELGRVIPEASLRDASRPEAMGRVAERSMSQPQRLELVLSASPVPNSGLKGAVLAAAVARRSALDEDRQATQSVTPAATGGEGTSDPAETDDEESESDAIKAIRGAFELRPEMIENRDGTRTPRLMASGGLVWELWWVPLPPREIDGSAPSGEDEPLTYEERAARALASGELGEPYRIAGNIAWLEWRMFHERERKRLYRAAAWSELPAYVELELETTTGLTGNWLFEVSADQGPEVPTVSDRATDGAAGRASGEAAGDPRSGAGSRLGEGAAARNTGSAGDKSGSGGGK